MQKKPPCYVNMSSLELLMDQAHEDPSSIERSLGHLLMQVLQYRRQLANTLGVHIRNLKSAYDKAGDSRKLPYALENFVNDVNTRQWIYSQCFSISTTHGCGGQCKWCAYGAFVTTTDGIDVMPLEQQIHLWEDMINITKTKNRFLETIPEDDEMIKEDETDNACNFYMYFDTDPFDDPHLPKLLDYLSKKYGGTPHLTTVIPRSKYAFDNLKIIAHKAWMTRELKNLIELIKLIDSAESILNQCDSCQNHQDVLQILISHNEIKNSHEWNFMLKELKTLESGYSDQNYYNDDDDYPAFFNIVLDKNEGTEDEMKTFVAKLNNWRETVGCTKTVRSFQSPIIDAMHLHELWNAIHKAINQQTTTKQIQQAYEFLAKWRQTGRFLFESVDKKHLNLDINYQNWEADNIKDLKAAITKKIIELKQKLGDTRIHRPIRISHTKLNNDKVQELKKGPYDIIMASHYENNLTPYEAGIIFYQDGATIADNWGIHCISGTQISLYGVFNSIGGRVTHEFPEGHITVPFEGFKEQTQLSKAGESLASLLNSVICLRTPHYGKYNGYEEIYIYDGNCVRHILFDAETYKVRRDTVVQKNVTHPDQITVQYPKPYLRRFPIERLIVRNFPAIEYYAKRDNNNIIRLASENGIPISFIASTKKEIHDANSIANEFNIKITIYSDMKSAISSEINKANLPDAVLICDNSPCNTEASMQTAINTMKTARLNGARGICHASPRYILADRELKRNAHAWDDNGYDCLFSQSEIVNTSEGWEVILRD